MSLKKGPLAASNRPNGEQVTWEDIVPPSGNALEESVLEVSLSWEILESHPGEVLSFFVGCPAGKDEIEIVPPLSSLYVTTPGKDRPGRHWFP
jgi:hypothetical protein